MGFKAFFATQSRFGLYWEGKGIGKAIYS